MFRLTIASLLFAVLAVSPAFAQDTTDATDTGATDPTDTAAAPTSTADVGTCILDCGTQAIAAGSGACTAV
jgi:hypothetical protein